MTDILRPAKILHIAADVMTNDDQRPMFIVTFETQEGDTLRLDLVDVINRDGFSISLAEDVSPIVKLAITPDTIDFSAGGYDV